jgi:L-cysteine desulfidase
MDLIREIFANEVFPAIGCTEPIACACTCAAAAEQLNSPVEKLELTVDPGTYKNGAAVTIPNSQGQKGNAIAAAMGAVIAKPALRLEILKPATPDILGRAKELIDGGRLTYRCKEEEKGFHIEVRG